MIEFTPQEVRLINGLRKAELQWRRMRWMSTAAAALSMVCGVLVMKWLINEIEAAARFSESHQAVIIAIIWPTFLLYALVVGGAVGVAVSSWFRDPIRPLLLKLLDAQQKQGSMETETQSKPN